MVHVTSRTKGQDSITRRLDRVRAAAGDPQALYKLAESGDPIVSEGAEHMLDVMRGRAEDLDAFEKFAVAVERGSRAAEAGKHTAVPAPQGKKREAKPGDDLAHAVKAASASEKNASRKARSK